MPYLFLLLSFLSAQEMRVWTDSQNRKLTASYLRADEANVYLKSPQGKDITYPIEKLSTADQDFIKKQTGEGKKNTNQITSSLNFSAAYPERVEFKGDPEIKTMKEDAEKHSFIYESAHYQYNCDVRLANSVVKGFALLFEATYLCCQKLPLGMNLTDEPKQKYKIYLYERYNQYIESGGLPGSAGVYRGDTKSVYVPLTSLGVKPVGSGYMLDRSQTNTTLAHEITHQLTPEVYFAEGMSGWFSEGLAEYIANTPYRAGAFQFKNNGKALISYVTAYGKKNQGGRAIGENVELISLKKFMHQDYSNFLANPQVNYGAGLLLTYYFIHLDGNGDGARLKACLQSLHENEDEEVALKKLLDGRDYKTLEKEISKGLKKEGVTISFASEE